MPNELNPYADCGCEDAVIDHDVGRYFVVCTGCGNCGPDETVETASAAWNAANPKEGKPDDAQTI